MCMQPPQEREKERKAIMNGRKMFAMRNFIVDVKIFNRKWIRSNDSVCTEGASGPR